jgi:hypothetical protein
MHDKKSFETSPSPSNVCTALGSGKVGCLETKHYGAIINVPVWYWPGGVSIVCSQVLPGVFPSVTKQSACAVLCTPCIRSRTHASVPLSDFLRQTVNQAPMLCTFFSQVLLAADCEPGGGDQGPQAAGLCGRLQLLPGAESGGA